MDIRDLQPCEVFGYFEEIARIPHGSGNVREISDYLVDFAKKHGLKVRRDNLLNVIIWKPATPDMEGTQTVILQGHMDMVTVKTADCDKDMTAQGLDLEIDGDYLFAKDTSLGADDGIAVAFILALLASDNISHPALEAVITVDEEIGMLGATGLDLSDLSGRLMLNIDSEEEGVFTAGCAGGATVGVEIDLGRHQVCGEILDITFEGLTGGHSGTEINCQRANAIELLGRFLNRMFIYADYDLVNIYGGEKDNAIAKYAGCRICTSQPDKIKYFVQKAMSVFKSEFRTTDPDLKISVRTAGNGQVSAYDTASRDKTVHLLAALPYGVIKQSYNIEGLVQTSVNKGILKEENDVLTLTMSVRSSVGSEKLEIIDKIQAAAKLAGAKINISGEYPAWEYAPYSRLRDTMVEVYRDMFKKEPVVNTIHAGVECGIIAEKLTGLDCVSFGPDILDIHTTDERLSISSTRRTWDFIKRVLAEL